MSTRSLKTRINNKTMTNKIFLGGTCNGSSWRDLLIQKLNQIEYFNPVVEDWTKECQSIEINEKENKCNVHFYCITSAMTGVFSIAEVVDSVHNYTKITILQVIPDGFTEGQLRSLEAVVDLVNSRGGIAYIDANLYRSSLLLNTCFSDCKNIK